MTPSAVCQGDPLYLLINLDRSIDRLQLAAVNLSENGFAFQRVAAVDGRTLDLSRLGICEQTYRRCHGRLLRPAEVGCYLSHLKAMSTFLATSCDYAVIFEDDVEVHGDTQPIIRDLVEHDLYGFDVIRLHGRRLGYSMPVQQITAGRALRVMATRVTGSMAYIVRRNAARRYLDRLLPFQVPYDHAFDRGLHLGLDIAFTVPWAVAASKAQDVSTINGPAPSTPRADKVGLFEKLPVLAWRAETEIARGIAAGACLARSRLFKPAGEPIKPSTWQDILMTL